MSYLPRFRPSVAVFAPGSYSGGGKPRECFRIRPTTVQRDRRLMGTYVKKPLDYCRLLFSFEFVSGCIHYWISLRLLSIQT